MLTTTTRKIFEKSGEGTYIVHVIRVPVDTEAGSGVASSIYFAGLSHATGKAIGMITTHNGDVLRSWKRVASIEEYFAVLGDKLVAIMIYPAPSPEPTVRDMLIKQYAINKADTDPVMDNERLNLIAALGLKRSNDGRASDSPDP